MDLQDKRKEYTLASGGRMFLLLGGIMLVFTAITNTGQYGVQMFMIAAEAAKGTKEYVEVLESAGMSILAIRIMGVAFIVTAVVEITCGILCIRYSNRVDKSRTTLRIVLGLLAVEIIMQIYLLIMRMSSIGMLLSALLMPLVLLWGVTRLRKLAKEDPDRVYALEKKADPRQGRQMQQSTKSLRERAMMSARKEPVETEPDTESMETKPEPEGTEAESVGTEPEMTELDTESMETKPESEGTGAESVETEPEMAGTDTESMEAEPETTGADAEPVENGLETDADGSDRTE